MARLAMETTKAPPPASTPAAASSMFEAHERRLAQEIPGLGSMKSIRAELDQVNAQMKEFETAEPDEVMQWCSGFSARLVEVRRLVFRIEDHLPHWKQLRTQEITPLIEEIRFQYEVASRILTARKFDWEMERGNT